MVDLSSVLPAFAYGDVFHIGLRVADIQAAQRDLTASMGLTWTSTVHIPMKAWVPEEGVYRDFELDMSHSSEGPIHYELLHGSPGSIWDTAGVEAGLHHVGVWVDDVGAVSSALVEEGWTIELAGQSPEEGYGGFAYIRSPAGVLFEPETPAGGGRERFDRWWGGGSLF